MLEVTEGLPGWSRPAGPLHSEKEGVLVRSQADVGDQFDFIVTFFIDRPRPR